MRRTSAGDTINLALHEVNRRAKLARAAAIIARGELDVIAPDALKSLRQVMGLIAPLPR